MTIVINWTDMLRANKCLFETCPQYFTTEFDGKSGKTITRNTKMTILNRSEYKIEFDNEHDEMMFMLLYQK